MGAKCYDCKYQGRVPGSAHSSCKHPDLDADSNVFGALVEMLSGKFNEVAKKLNIKGNPMGMRNGWFSWPADFDPTWLVNCDGFSGKDK